MVNKTIFGEPVGKWALGTTDTQGTEVALSGKFIGDTVAIDYPTVAVRVPERTGLSENILGLAIIAALGYYAFRKTR